MTKEQRYFLFELQVKLRDIADRIDPNDDLFAREITTESTFDLARDVMDSVNATIMALYRDEEVKRVVELKKKLGVLPS